LTQIELITIFLNKCKLIFSSFQSDLPLSLIFYRAVNYVATTFLVAFIIISTSCWFSFWVFSIGYWTRRFASRWWTGLLLRVLAT